MGQLFFISLLLLFPISIATQTSLSERTLSDFGSLNLGLWNVDLNEVYDFFASPAVQRNFFIVQTSKVGPNETKLCQLYLFQKGSLGHPWIFRWPRILAGEFHIGEALLDFMIRACEETRRWHRTPTSKVIVLKSGTHTCTNSTCVPRKHVHSTMYMFT